MARFQGGRTGVVVAAGRDRVVDLVASLAAFARQRPGEAELLGVLLPTPEGSWEALIRAGARARAALEGGHPPTTARRPPPTGYGLPCFATDLGSPI
ncbi:MAG TPA: hypothetical protein VKY90_21190 [Candidatus Dormibacteraeota bacterium]|nr:hypothetical protein [Candidatus Dormibacteraeota bacterium]